MASDFLAKIKLTLEGKEAVVQGLQQAQTAAKQLSTTPMGVPWGAPAASAQSLQQLQTGIKGVGEETKKSFNQMNDFEKALRRAVIVAPVWMAARAVMQFFVEGIKSGIDYLIKLDQQMLLLEQSLRALGQTPNIEALGEQFDKLSLNTGKATTDIVSAYRIFVKITGDAKTAMEGNTAATHLQEVAQTKSEDVIKAVALAYKLQGDTIANASTPTEKFAKIVANLNELAAKNNTEVDSLAKEYLSFVPTAKALNLTFEQTLSLLATMNSQGVQNVMGLRTAFTRLLSEQGKVSQVLGIAITPNVTPYQQFVAILEKINSLTTQGKPIPSELTQLIGGAGGGGGRQTTAIILGLGKALELLQSNVKTTYSSETLLNFNKNLNLIDKSLSHQVEIADNVKKHIFAAFVEGLKGADFTEKLTKLNEVLKEKGESEAKSIGEFLRRGFKNGVFGFGDEYATQAMRILKISQDLKSELAKTQESTKINIPAQNLQNQRAVEAKIVEEIKNKEREITEQKIQEATETEQLTSKAKERLYTANEQIKLEALEAEGLSHTQASYVEIIDLVGKLAEAHDKATDPLTNKLIPALDKQVLLNSILKGDYETIISLLRSTTDIESRLPEIEKVRGNLIKNRINDLNKEKDTIGGLLVQYEKANAMDKSKIRRQIELTAMPEEDVVARYRNSSYDRRLILDMFSSFSKPIQQAIQARIAFEHGINPARELFGAPGEGIPGRINSTQVTQQANFGNIEINIKPEDLDKLSLSAATQLQQVLEKDTNLQKFLAKVIRPNI